MWLYALAGNHLLCQLRSGDPCVFSCVCEGEGCEGREGGSRVGSVNKARLAQWVSIDL